MIRVAGLEYCVRLSNDAGDFSGDLNGEVNYNVCTITIRSDLNLAKQQQTLMHELTHIIVEGEESGAEKADEQYVTRISNILYGILSENQMLHPDWWKHVVDEQPAWATAATIAGARGRRRQSNRPTKRKH